MADYQRKKNIEPPDCVYLGGLPADRKTFIEHQTEYGERSYVYNDLWDYYEGKYLDVWRKATERIHLFGVEVMASIRLEDIKQFSKTKEVIAIHTHNFEGRLEMHDGFWSAPDIADVLGSDFSGTLHLSACYSLDLARGIKSRVPRCHIVSSNRELNPYYWLTIDQAVFKVLQERPQPYSTALATAVKLLCQ